MTSILQILSAYEQKKLQSLYDEKKQLNNKICFTDFCAILKTLSQLSPSVLQSFADTLRKDLKAKTNLDNESGIMVNQADYFKYIRQLIIENNRYLNQRDPELKELFTLLAGERETLTKKGLMEILRTFDIPLEYDSFYAYSDHKKEEMAFEDFCALFKPTEKKELFMRTLVNGFDFSTKEQGPTEHIFPIQISKRV